MSTPIKDATVAQLETVKTFFLKDLATLSDEQLTSKPNGCARRPIDFGYEVASANRSICRMLQQLPPEPEDESRPKEEKDGEWTAAPIGYTRAQLESDVVASIDDIITVVNNATEEQLLTKIPTWFGEQPMFAFAGFATMHTNYHNGQLAYVAQLGGDLKNYWF